MNRCPSCQAAFPADYTICPRDGSSLVSVGEWTEGTLVRGKYRIIAKVGQGGMASVYKATHERFKEIRALKVIIPELASDSGFVRRFEQEAIVTRRLQHPNAVRVDDIDEADDGRPFIVMEYIEGRSLKDTIEQEAPMAVKRACSIIEQAAGALDAAHAIGLVHRDIKPGNIALLSALDSSGMRSEQVKILDFGIAKLKEAHLHSSKGDETSLTLTSTGMVIGTPAYMSPEQARGLKGESLDGRSDLYSLGIVMYQMLTGELPLKADSTIEQLMAHLNVPPKPIRSVRPDIPPGIAAAVMRCLEKNRELRPRNGQALIDELQAPNARSTSLPPGLSATAIGAARVDARVADNEPVPFPTATTTVEAPVLEPVTPALDEAPTQRTADQKARNRSQMWIWAALIAVLVVAGFALAFYLRQPAKHSTSQANSSTGPASSDVHTTNSAASTTSSASAERTSPNSPPTTPEISAKPHHPQPPRTSAAESNPPATTSASNKTVVPSTPAANYPPEKKPMRVQVSPGVIGGLLISKVNPSYPSVARQARVQGPVVLKAVIAKDGGIKDLELMSGHPMLAPAAVEAVKQWKYRPYILNGEPVEVDTQIQINFTLGDQPPAGTTGAAVASTSDQIYHVGGGVSAPALISRVDPQFTDEARRAKVNGASVLSVVVDTTGRPQNIKVVRPLGFGLDQKAIEAVQQWRFQPAMKDGKPVNVEIGLEVDFRLY